eukprot:gene26249-biopygen15280
MCPGRGVVEECRSVSPSNHVSMPSQVLVGCLVGEQGSDDGVGGLRRTKLPWRHRQIPQLRPLLTFTWKPYKKARFQCS